jgi:methyl-accepting chemotaxis protein
MPKRYKRKTYYFKNSAQTSFILWFVSVSIMGGIIAVMTFNIFAAHKIDTALYSMHLPSGSDGGFLWNEMLYANAIVVVFILAFFGIIARKLFVQIQVPLQKITSHINKIEGGDLSLSLSLRNGDEFKDFADDLNRMVESLNERFRLIKKAGDQLTDSARSASSLNFSEKQLREINRNLHDLEKSLGLFKI